MKPPCEEVDETCGGHGARGGPTVVRADSAPGVRPRRACRRAGTDPRPRDGGTRGRRAVRPSRPSEIFQCVVISAPPRSRFLAASGAIDAALPAAAAFVRRRVTRGVAVPIGGRTVVGRGRAAFRRVARAARRRRVGAVTFAFGARRAVAAVLAVRAGVERVRACHGSRFLLFGSTEHCVSHRACRACRRIDRIESLPGARFAAARAVGRRARSRMRP